MFNTILVTDDGSGHWRDGLRLARYLGSSGTSCVLGSFTSPSEVAEAASRERADLIVVGSTRGAARLLRGAPVPVAIPHRGLADAPNDRIRVVGVGFDGQPESRAALRTAEQIALEHEATIRVFAVVLPNAMATSRIEESLEGDLYEEVERLDSRVRAAAHASRGEPTRALVARSREGLDLLVVGSRGYGPLRRVVFGSVSSEIIGRAECPVLVLPRQASAKEDLASEPPSIAATR